jgi:DNA-binding CsgD family transcriptional regulator
MAQKLPALTDREAQMLELMATGIPTSEIGKRLGYTSGTIRVYLHNLYKKLGVKTRSEATAWIHASRGHVPTTAVDLAGFTLEDRAAITLALYATAAHWTDIYVPMRAAGNTKLREEAKKKLECVRRMKDIADRMQRNGGK